MAARDPEGTKDVIDVVRVYIERVPGLYGIPIRDRSWKRTFSSFSYNREEVIMGLARHLEHERKEWEGYPSKTDLPPQSPPKEETPPTKSEEVPPVGSAPEATPPTQQQEEPDTPQNP